MRGLDSVVALDVETGGLDPLQHSILEVALASQGAELRLLISEPYPVAEEEALAINGLSLEVCESEGMAPSDAVDEIERFMGRIERPMLVGHNIAFDLAFMRRLYRMAHRAVPKCFARTLDTHTLLWALAWAGKIQPQACTSSGAFETFRVEMSGPRHTALVDARATLELLGKILEVAAPVGMFGPLGPSQHALALLPKIDDSAFHIGRYINSALDSVGDRSVVEADLHAALRHLVNIRHPLRQMSLARDDAKGAAR